MLIHITIIAKYRKSLMFYIATDEFLNQHTRRLSVISAFFKGAIHLSPEFLRMTATFNEKFIHCALESIMTSWRNKEDINSIRAAAPIHSLSFNAILRLSQDVFWLFSYHVLYLLPVAKKALCLLRLLCMQNQ